ncbi:amino acid aminotransferase [Marinobacterium arenosum]|uniref:amino acid aminotransferase n=1 Tax=Marinobacterium arenosum TaxID=2862496 RepID=UPI001C948C22|nr:aromatic amino acid transaminase [Marinobacterium arenosum]MBY4677908.1 aromatic amino acid transaminase [Marinobacterium arenosum]
MLEQIPSSPVDPILQVMAQFHADPRPDKIDLGIGVLRDEQGHTPVLAAVKEAERHLLATQQSKAYLGPAGSVAFNRKIIELLWPDNPQDPCLACIQTPGGTGALRVAGDLLNFLHHGSRLWLSDPPWVTHRSIFPAAGLHLCSYRYFDPQQGRLDFDGMLEDLAEVQFGDAVLLQVSGHNPCGCDPTPNQWQTVAELLSARGALPILDLAYHGLVDDLARDRLPLALINRHHREWLLCYSTSKTFGLYNERTGALMIHAAEPEVCQRVYAEALNRICGNYYMPPNHGAAVVDIILGSEELRSHWQQELNQAQQKVHQTRQALLQALQQRHPDRFDYIAAQKGLFSYLSLNDAQLEQLRNRHAIYIGSGGRINISGLNEGNLARVADALVEL